MRFVAHFFAPFCSLLLTFLLASMVTFMVTFCSGLTGVCSRQWTPRTWKSCAVAKEWSRSTGRCVLQTSISILFPTEPGFPPRVPQVALSFDEKSGVYNHHCVNQEHLIGYDASQNHQKVAALLTLGELLVEGTIPVGTLRAGAFNNPPNQEQIKDAFESYPWFSWNSGVLTLVQKFKMDLKGDGDDELFKDACIDIYKKSCVLGGEYTNFDKCQRRVLKTWTQFGLDGKKKLPPPPPPPASAATAAAAAAVAAAAAAAAAASSSAAAATDVSKLSERNATVWKVLTIFSADTVDRLEEHCGAIGGDGGKLMKLKDLQAAVCGEDGTDISRKRNFNGELCSVVIDDFTKVLGAKPEPE